MDNCLKVKELVCLCVGSGEIIPVEEIPTTRYNSPSGGSFKAFVTEAQDAIVLQHKASGDIIIVNTESTEPEIVTDIERWAEVRCHTLH